MLTTCSVQLLYGRIYKLFPVKYVFLVAIAVFEIGSAVCGAAPSSNALIVGRAIAGTGAAGIMSGVMQILVHVVPLEKRPLFAGLFGAVGGISAVVGPLLGGVFTERLSWRWCFYINLPFGAVSVAAVMILMKNFKPLEGSLQLSKKLSLLDLTGTTFFVPCMTCLILALEWGGDTYAWNNWRIILLFVIFGVLFSAWLVIQAWKQEDATLPPRIFFQRSIVAGFVYNTTISASLMIVVYYIPLWFQAVKGQNPSTSGVSVLPSILSLVVASILSGVFTQRVGYYWPPMNASPILASVGAGLLTTLKVDTGHSKWIGFQVLFGLGAGLGLQQATLAAQAVLPGPDISTGISVIFFGQQLGGAIFLAIAETIFDQKLTNSLQDIPGANADAIIKAGAADIQNNVPAFVLPQVLSAYNNAVTATLYLATGAACITLIPALFIEWKNIKSKRKDTGTEVTSTIGSRGREGTKDRGSEA